ncbi:hypothetical protein [Phenylobacterium sp.]|jgi:hypothetical protein|uniref:hypothetical protein n=1 Tax=Phenylobacterium sp. TaxID=1871053 RepID=UPI002F3EF45B
MRKPLLSLIAVAALAGAWAAPALTRAAEEKKTKEVGQYVDLQPVALPIVVDGRLVNYVFVYVRVNLKASADIIKLRDKEPMFRDALVRDGHKTPFVLPNDWQKLDDARLIAAMTRDANAIAPGAVASVTITQQSPQKRVMPPRPAPPDMP